MRRGVWLRTTAAAILLATLAAPASYAANIRGDEAERWDAVADASQVQSTPDWFPVRVREQECPFSSSARGCYDPNDATIYLNPSSGTTSRVFLHELAHAFDQIVLSPDDRDEYRRLFPQTEGWPWMTADGSPAAGEWFAESHSRCAADRVNPPSDGDSPYGYAPSAEEHQRVCAWIDGRRGDSGFDSPPETPASPPPSSTSGAPRHPPVVPAPKRLRSCRARTRTIKDRARRRRALRRCRRRDGAPRPPRQT